MCCFLFFVSFNSTFRCMLIRSTIRSKNIISNNFSRLLTTSSSSAIRLFLSSPTPRRHLPLTPPLPTFLPPHQHRSMSTSAAASLTLPPLEGVEAAKRAAAYASVDNHVLPEHMIIGIGSGSTVPYVVERIVQQGKKVNEKRWFVPTGFQSKELIVQAGE